MLAVHRYADLGGAEEVARVDARLLQEAGHEVVVAFGWEPEKREPINSIRDYYVASLRWTGHGGDAGVQDVLAIERPDIVHFHLNYAIPRPDVVALTAKALPTVYTVHNHLLTCVSAKLYDAVHQRPRTCCVGLRCFINAYRLGCTPGYPMDLLLYNYRKCLRNRWAARRVARLLVLCGFMADTLSRGGFPRKQIRIVPPYIPLTKCYTTAPEKREDVVLYVGRVTVEKGLHLLLVASRRATVPHRVVVVGDGPALPKVKELALKLGIQAEFTGWLSKEKLVQWYRRAALLVVPSLWPEPFGLTGPEAMSQGCPVVAFDVGGISTWLKDGENGYLVPVGEVEGLAGRVVELLRSRGLVAEMGQRGQDLTHDMYGLDKHLHSLLGVYKECGYSGEAHSMG